MKPWQILLFMAACCLLLPAAGHSEIHLTLVDGEQQQQLMIDDLRQQAEMEFTIFAPFRGREVKMRGILLETLLARYLARVPQRIRLVAHDDYELIFDGWPTEHWVVVTHEDGEPLSMRNQGPLRLVEREFPGKDPKNLRDFNDWIWMLKRIEALP